jgi:5-methylcytosine-specific restriction endonuclease McrA
MEKCCEKIRSDQLRSDLSKILPSIVEEERLYDREASVQNLSAIKKTSDFNWQVSRDDLKSLYTNRMVPKGSPGRSIYDKLLLLPPNDICPYCGQRQVSTLDHYLPKNHYSHLSILPFNLIACCKDCNFQKSDAIPTSNDDLFIHPYYENIDNEEWLYCSLNNVVPFYLEFFIRKPANWSPSLFMRLNGQFDKLELKSLYGVHAISEFHSIHHNLHGLNQRGGSNFVQDWLIEAYDSAKNYRRNSWRTAFYRELANNEEFYSSDFH